MIFDTASFLIGLEVGLTIVGIGWILNLMHIIKRNQKMYEELSKTIQGGK